MRVLGISAFYHDSAAALVCDGEIIAAAQEERFTRTKHDPGFPANAIAYCLKEAKIDAGGVDRIVFYEKPFLKFERLIETYLAFAPRGFASFRKAMPLWIGEKLFQRDLLLRELARIDPALGDKAKLRFSEHHFSHAASAYYPSLFQSALVLTMDGVGEWATTSAGIGQGEALHIIKEIHFPHSLGLLYSAFTYYTGFKVNSGEYKVMGLAPYGEPRYVDLILGNLIDLKDDGTFRLNMDYFNFATGLTMTNGAFARLFGAPPRAPEAPLTQHEMDLARSIQDVTEEVVLRLARTVRRELGVDNLCMAGGVALNCVANGRVLRESGVRDLWIQPAAGDAGGALGAALAAWHGYHAQPRTASGDKMQGSYLGPSFSDEEIRAALDAVGAHYEWLPEEELLERVAGLLAAENVVGWFQGRMEFGPRALGNRSIIGDARSPRMQSVMNLKIKYRESFRPFAPAVLAERVTDYFELDRPSPYMLIVTPVRPELRLATSAREAKLFGIEKLNVPRSTIPAVTHVDYSARIQTIHAETNPRFHGLLKRFEALTGVAVLVNTSFNVRGEPIVCSPADAYLCFRRTEMDCLVVGNFILTKAGQPPMTIDQSWMKEFELD